MTCSENTRRAKKIAELNDTFRRTFVGGRVVVTHGVTTLTAETRAAVLNAVRNFSAFTSDNDPHGEHDFGFIKVDEHDLFWKIDYYDPTLSHHTEDPTDPAVTMRILTIMLTEEY